jgi:hypothetical protein
LHGNPWRIAQNRRAAQKPRLDPRQQAHGAAESSTKSQTQGESSPCFGLLLCMCARFIFSPAMPPHQRLAEIKTQWQPWKPSMAGGGVIDVVLSVGRSPRWKRCLVLGSKLYRLRYCSFVDMLYPSTFTFHQLDLRYFNSTSFPIFHLKF